MDERTFSFTGSGEQSTSGVAGDPYGAVDLGGNGDTGGSNNGGTGGSGDDFTFDPARHIGADRVNADGTYRRKRQRRGGDGGTIRPRVQKADISSSIDALTQTLIIVHAGLASVTKIREFSIDAAEGKALATALANVLVEFDIPIDRKTQAIVGLIVAGASTYGPRLYLYNERMKAEKASRSGKVVPMTPEIIMPEGFKFDGNN